MFSPFWNYKVPRYTSAIFIAVSSNPLFLHFRLLSDRRFQLLHSRFSHALRHETVYSKVL